MITEPTLDNVSVYGNLAEYTASHPGLYASTSQALIRFSTSSPNLSILTSGSFTIDWRVDDGDWTREDVGSITILNGSSGSRVIDLMVSSVNYNQYRWQGVDGVQVESITTDDGYPIYPSPLSLPRMGFLGDSIAEGLNIYNGLGTSTGSDGRNAWPTLLADSLNYEPYVHGYGGCGLINNPLKTPNLLTTYGFVMDSVATWHGTYEVICAMPYANDESYGAENSAEYITFIHSMLAKFRDHSPNAKIFYGSAPQPYVTPDVEGVSADWGVEATKTAIIEDASRATYLTSPDAIFVDTHNWTITPNEFHTDNHPGLIGQQEIATGFEGVITPILVNYMTTTILGRSEYVYKAYNGKVFSQDGIVYYRGVSNGDSVSVAAVGLTSY